MSKCHIVGNHITRLKYTRCRVIKLVSILITSSQNNFLFVCVDALRPSQHFLVISGHVSIFWVETVLVPSVSLRLEHARLKNNLNKGRNLPLTNELE